MPPVPTPVSVPTPTPSVDVLGSVAPTSPTFNPPKLTPIVPVVDPMASIATSPAPAADIPDWLKNTTDRLTSTPDPLANVVPSMGSVPEVSPVVEVATIVTPPVGETAPLPASEAALPDWLVGSNVTDESSIESSSSTESPEETYTETFEATSSEVPMSDTSEVTTDVLREETTEVSANSDYLPIAEISTPTPEPEIAAAPETAFTPAEVLVPTVEELPQAPEVVTTPEPTPVADELPDWLKNFAPTPTVTPQNQPIVKEEDDIFGDALIEKQFGFPATETVDTAAVPSDTTVSNAPKVPKPKKQKASTPMPEIKPTVNTDDLPDWLK